MDLTAERSTAEKLATVQVLSLELLDHLDSLEGENICRGKLKTKLIEFRVQLEKRINEVDSNMRSYAEAEEALRVLRKRLSEYIDTQLFEK